MNQTHSTLRLYLLLPALLLFFSSCGQSTDNTTDLPPTTIANSGFNRDSIENLITSIHDTPPNDFRGLVVIKDNEIVVEEYFNTFWRVSIHDIRSAGKSITAMLLCVAIKEGLVQNLEQDVYSFFPKKKYPDINEDYKKITLRHLLNMSSGLDADTERPETIGHAGHWMGKDDWKEYLLNVPVTSTPGKEWVYADINALLVGMVIEETSGMSLKDFAQEKLFDPLGIKQIYWFTNATNQTGAAGNLYLSTLDFAKLGQLIANEGIWQNNQIISADYIEILKSRTFDISNEFFLADAYGMMWYKSQRTFNGNNVDYMFAAGNGGNQLIVIPEHEIVIALTSGAYGQRYAHRRSYQIMGKIITALER